MNRHLFVEPNGIVQTGVLFVLVVMCGVKGELDTMVELLEDESISKKREEIKQELLQATTEPNEDDTR